MKKEVLKVTGMSCAHCENRVNTAVTGISGVKDCKASAKKSEVTVKYDEAAASIDAVKAAITDAGYTVG